MKLLARWLVSFLGIMATRQLFPDSLRVDRTETVAIFALVLAVLNVFVRPVLGFFALPITCLTLGLFHFIINALVFMLAASLVPGVELQGFATALIGSLIVSLLGVVMSLFVK